jgi:hypothetical protein
MHDSELSGIRQGYPSLSTTRRPLAMVVRVRFGGKLGHSAAVAA